MKFNRCKLAPFFEKNGVEVWHLSVISFFFCSAKMSIVYE